MDATVIQGVQWFNGSMVRTGESPVLCQVLAGTSKGARLAPVMQWRFKGSRCEHKLSGHQLGDVDQSNNGSCDSEDYVKERRLQQPN